MARPRLPRAKAKITGASTKQKARFAERHEPIVADGVGDPPEWMNAQQGAVWKRMSSKIPWLNSSHGYLLGIAVYIQARLENGDECGVQAMNLLRQALGQMGATPADASKAGVKPDESKEPGQEFFDRDPE